MHEILKNFTAGDAAEVLEIVENLKFVNSTSIPELEEFTSDVHTLQPIILSVYVTFRELLNFTDEQMAGIQRYLTVIWMYYREILPPKKKISVLLFKQLKDEQESWMRDHAKKDKAVRKDTFSTWMEEYPAKSLLLILQNDCISYPESVFKTMAETDRLLVFLNFKVLMDCFEWLIKRY